MKNSSNQMYILLLHVFICFITVSNGFLFSDTTKYRGSSCTHTSGEPGVCERPSECRSEKLVDLKKNHCSFERHTPIICCPQSGLIKNSPIVDNVTTVVLGVEPPNVDFACGERPLRPLGHPNLRSRRQINHLANPERADVKINIVGGIESNTNSWPWTAIVGEKINSSLIVFHCTASLINRRFVISAAHCLKENINLVRVGDHDITSSFDGTNPVDYDIEEEFIHSDYVYPKPYDDLVLYRVIKDIVFNDFIKPVCLPWGEIGSEDLLGRQLTITGWGATNFNQGLSNVLMEADIAVFETSFCDSAYTSVASIRNTLDRGVPEENFLCAGNTTHRVDSCNGDSGGPAVFQASGRYYLMGVVSVGIGCGDIRYPGLYVNIRSEKYLQWIKDVAFS